MLSPKFQSSGDLLADRRFEWARDCEARGDLVGAAELMEQVLEIAPGYASGWFSLGRLREKLGERTAAIDAFRKAREADPQDVLGAALMLMRLGAENTAEMPQAYVRELFDQYAPAFDKALQENLQYRAPTLLQEAVRKVCSRNNRTMLFRAVLDLGCGTGLAGEVFRGFAERLCGVDISPGMIAEARRKMIYDRLAVDDMMHFLAEEAGNGAEHDLVVAADVFVYAADLNPVISSAARILAPQGLLAFTVETHNEEGAILGEKLRYAHSESHVRAALKAGGLRMLHLDPVSTRMEGGVPVPGLLVIAASTSPWLQP